MYSDGSEQDCEGRRTDTGAVRLVDGNAEGDTERRSGVEVLVPLAVGLVGTAEDGGDYPAERRDSNLFAAVAGVSAARWITTLTMGINRWIEGHLAVNPAGTI